MAWTSDGLPERFPVGSTYVVEARGSVRGLTLMHRYVQFPDGRRVELAARLVRPCQCAHATDANAIARANARAATRSAGADSVTVAFEAAIRRKCPTTSEIDRLPDDARVGDDGGLSAHDTG